MRLVLGLKGLSGAEMGLVRTILRLSSGLRADWTVSEGADADVVLLGDKGEAPGVSPRTTVVPVLRREEQPQGRCLYRPIRAEELIDMLNGEAERRAAPDIVPLPASPGGAARLHRWPPHALLSGRPYHVQLATLLSKHALTAEKLSRLSARPLADCEAFMQELDSLGLLAWQPLNAPAAAAVPRSTPAAPAHPAQRRGLLSTLRHKLGISRIAA